MATAPTNIQEALRGKAAGVMVAGGGLNDTPMIRIRGNRSISASNEPLFVIDGVPVNGGSDVLNPSDVASIEILKMLLLQQSMERAVPMVLFWLLLKR